MPIITQNFDEIPDTIPIIGSGIYNAEITKADVAPNKKKKEGKSEAEGGVDQLVVEFKILNEGPFKDLKITGYINHTNQYGKISMGRLAKSAKIDTSQGLNTDDLLGKIAKLVVEEGTYTPPTGTPRKTSQIRDYLIPSDDGYNS